jgi:hypothetical protein
MIYECPYCGEIFEANLVKGPEELPPCLSCAFEGKEPKPPTTGEV